MTLPPHAVTVAAGLAAAVAASAVAVLTTDGGAGGKAPPQRPAGGTQSTGAALFARMGCGGCHRLAAAGANGRFGPDLDRRLPAHTSESLAAQILSPRPGMGMPTNFGERMSDAELHALVGFLLAARRSP